uniref:Spermatogenesis associated 17 n=1 Tax=Cyprinus carpio TaxID=7962 RepID=A0A8C2EN27_CYPCA
MARLEKLYKQVDNIKEQYFIRNRIAQENREKENEAAVRIQSWFRGCQVREFLSHLHKNATLIQKIWRGFTARALFRQRVKTAYFIMKMNFYNKMAVKWVTHLIWMKSVNNFYCYSKKKYINMIYKDIYLHWIYLSACQCRKGVFNSPFRTEPDETELRLRKVRPLLVRSAPKERKNPNITPDLNNLMPNRERLPPIHKKPQGPFRPALEVQQQRHRPLEPSLRVATSITALEEAREELKRQEWRTCVIDQTFLPFSNTSQNKRYESMMRTSTPFEEVAYGTKHFREEHKEYLKGKKVHVSLACTCRTAKTHSVCWHDSGSGIWDL